MSSQEESSKKGTPLRRRRFIVDKPFQYRLIGLLLAIWAANSIFFTIILYYFYEGHIQRFYELIPKHGIAPLISAQGLFALAVGFVAVFGIVMVVILGAYLSNQIAGPLYRVKLCLNRISEGDINFEIRFRNRDFLQDFPGYFNNMLRGLKDESAGDLDFVRAIENNLDDVNKARLMLREYRQKKEQKLGLSSEDQDPPRSGEQVSQAVH